MYYFIVNRNCRGGRGKKVWEKVEAVLKKKKIEYEAYLTKQSGDARTFAREISEKKRDRAQVLVVLGGDGTINEVLDGLAFENPVTLGYIPAGSGNDLARSLKLPQNPIKALQHILSPKYYKIMDYGVLSYGKEELLHRRFAVSSGIGFDAAVCHELLYSDIRKKFSRIHMEKLVYLMVGLKRFMLAKPVKGYIILDGTRKVEFHHLYFISAHIHPFEGGGFCFASGADDSDGMLDLSVFNSDSKRKLFAAMFRAYLGKRKNPKSLRNFRCHELIIHIDQPMPVHVDGESCYSQTDLQIRCVKRMIRMIV